MKPLQTSLLMFILLSLSACSSTYKIPTSRLYSPESEGEHATSLAVGYHANQEVTLTTDISGILIPNSTHPVATNRDIGGYAVYGLRDKIDLGASMDLTTSPFFFAKYQFLGEGRPEAESGNFSASIMAGVGYDFEKTENSSALFSSQKGSVHRDESFIGEFGPIVGYRVSDPLLLIAGGSYYYRHISGTHTQTSPTASASFDEKARFYQVHLGMKGTLRADEEGKGAAVQVMLYRGFLNTIGGLSTSTTGSIDLLISF